MEAVPERRTALVYLFKPSGKFYTDEQWEIPFDAIGPADMSRSVNFRRIDGGAVLVPTQEPWGFPALFPQRSSNKLTEDVYSTDKRKREFEWVTRNLAVVELADYDRLRKLREDTETLVSKLAIYEEHGFVTLAAFDTAIKERDRFYRMTRWMASELAEHVEDSVAQDWIAKAEEGTAVY